jgi:hypothetical protein
MRPRAAPDTQVSAPAGLPTASWADRSGRLWRNLPDFSIPRVRTGQKLQLGNSVPLLVSVFSYTSSALSSAILSSTRTYPKNEISSGGMRERSIFDAQPLTGPVVSKSLRYRKSDTLIRTQHRSSDGLIRSPRFSRRLTGRTHDSPEEVSKGQAWSIGRRNRYW